MHKQLDPQELIDGINDDLVLMKQYADTLRAENIRLAHDNRELLKELQRFHTARAMSEAR